jgi:hypothetical protein
VEKVWQGVLGDVSSRVRLLCCQYSAPVEDRNGGCHLKGVLTVWISVARASGHLFVMVPSSLTTIQLGFGKFLKRCGCSFVNFGERYGG